MTHSAVLPYLWMLIGSFALALMGSIAHALGPTYDWQVIVLARVSLQLLFALLLAGSAGVPLRITRPPLLWVRSIAGSVSMVGQFFAYTRLPVSDVLTLANMFPLWVAVLSWPLLRQRPSAVVWLGVVSGVAGVFLMQQPNFAAGNFAALLAVASSLTTAIAMLALNRLQAVDARAIIVHFSAVALVCCVGSFFLFERAVAIPPALSGWPVVLLLGVGVAALVGQLFLTRAYAAGDAAGVSVVNLTQIVFAMLFDVLLFGHTFSPTTLLGMALVVAPTAGLMILRGR